MNQRGESSFMFNTSKINVVFAALVLTLLGSSAWAAPQAGDRALTLSGTGNSDKKFNNNNFGMSGELGYFTSDSLELGVRQSVNGSIVDNGRDAWAGATRGFADWHFGGPNAFQPFLGLNVGGLYGDNVKETWAAGPEAGMKYYVRDKTYIQFQAEYEFLFQNADDVDNTFDDGAFFYTLGIGYNF